jgi:hypothetical protein
MLKSAFWMTIRSTLAAVEPLPAEFVIASLAGAGACNGASDIISGAAAGAPALLTCVGGSGTAALPHAVSMSAAVSAMKKMRFMVFSSQGR